MLNQQQYTKLQTMGLSPTQMNQVVQAAGGVEQRRSAAGFMGNIVKSGVRTVGELGSALVNTVNPDMEKNTVANLGKLVLGTLQYIDPTQALGTKYEKNAKAVGQFYIDRYGGVDKIMNTLYNDPVGMALDVASVLSGAGGALKASGSVSKVAGLTKVGNAFTKAAEFVDPISALAKGGGKLASGTRSRLASGLERTGENLITRGIGNPAEQAKAARKAGRSVSSFIDEYNLYDRSPESASKVRRGILSQYDDLALRSGSQVKMGQVIKSFNDEIANLQTGVGGVVSDANQAKIVELTRRRDQLIQAAGGNANSSPLAVGTDTLTNFRREVIDPDVPQSMFNLDARGSGSAQGVKRSRDLIKGAIDSTDPRLAKLGKDYGMARSVEKILERSASRGNNRRVMSLPKQISGGVGGMMAGIPGVIGAVGFDYLTESPAFIKTASKAMKSTANALNSPKIPDLTKRMGKVVNPAYNLARTGRMVNNASRDLTLSKTTTPQKSQMRQSALPKVSPHSFSYSAPKNKTSQAFSGSVKVQRGSFY